MSDGGFAVAGRTDSSGGWDRDAWVLKFDRWGRLTCGPDAPCDVLTPADCADGDPCTSDDCAAGTGCVNESTEIFCDDGNSCTGDVCHSVGGACRHDAVADGLPCDDGDPASSARCAGGLCEAS